MVYTVGEMAKMLEVPASTLRYYDKEGLLPFVERSPGGMRMFQEKEQQDRVWHQQPDRKQRRQIDEKKQAMGIRD